MITMTVFLKYKRIIRIPLHDLKDTLVIKGPNVGIGITNPTQKLEVDGWVKKVIIHLIVMTLIFQPYL